MLNNTITEEHAISPHGGHLPHKRLTIVSLRLGISNSLCPSNGFLLTLLPFLCPSFYVLHKFVSVNFFVCVCVNFFFRKEKTTLSLVSSRSLLASLREQIRERKALGMKAPYPELCAVNDNGYVHETGVLHTNMCAKEPYKGCHQERAGFNTSRGVYIEGGVLKT